MGRYMALKEMITSPETDGSRPAAQPAAQCQHDLDDDRQLEVVRRFAERLLQLRDDRADVLRRRDVALR